MAAFYDPQGVLINWNDGAGWTLTDALSGVLTTGAIGSGKSSGPGDMLRRAFLRKTSSLPGGMGGIVFFAKNGEANEWETICHRLGRTDDVRRITPGGRYQFNFMEWIASWGEGEERGPIPTVALLEEIASVITPASGEGGAGENTFFEGAHRNKLTNLVHVIQLAGLPVSLPLMHAISSSGPENMAQGKDAAWQKRSECWAILQEAEAATKGDPQAQKDLRICRDYFLKSYPALSDRTRGVVEIMFDSLVRPFVTRPLRTLFCEGMNIRPEMIFEGKIFLIDIPVQEYHQTAQLAALAFKRTAQLAIMRRSGPPGSLRPCFLFADEAQNFLSPSDAEYQAVARSAGGVTCLLTQQVSSIREALGSRDRAENLISNLQTKFFCQNSGETAHYAANLIGGRFTQVTNLNIGRSANVQDGTMGDTGMTGGVGRSEQERPWIMPGEFQKLARGGAANDYWVEAVVFAGGKMFKGEREMQPYKILAFQQEKH